MKKPDIWMPLYIGDYLADTIGLSHAQHGAYLLAIMAYWRKGGPLSEAEAQAIMGSEAASLARFFNITDDGWSHSRIDSELASAETRREKKSQAGRKGNAVRYNCDSTDTSTGSQCDSTAIANPRSSPSPSPSPSPSQSEPQSVLASQTTPDQTRDDLLAVPEFLDKRRGSRLPDGWQPSPELLAWANTECPIVDCVYETEKFTDFWRSQAGAKARKTDWDATWRNWMRKAGENGKGSRENGFIAIARGYTGD
ncbi:MAG: DUF1376 domain-containing protein [Myxococcales bacterium]|nr:MAG: DUF1376 domain-containing protein [Myxococcales bacterium]